MTEKLTRDKRDELILEHLERMSEWLSNLAEINDLYISQVGEMQSDFWKLMKTFDISREHSDEPHAARAFVYNESPEASENPKRVEKRQKAFEEAREKANSEN